MAQKLVNKKVFVLKMISDLDKVVEEGGIASGPWIPRAPGPGFSYWDHLRFLFF